LEGAKRALEQSTIRKAILDEEFSKIANELSRKEKYRQSKLDEIAAQTLGFGVAQRVVKHSAKARETLRKYREEIAQRHMSRLEALITAAFARLHRKKATKHAVFIDRDSYELRVVDEGGRPIQASELSAGERQLLAVSVLWALAQASGRRLPTVIDTPLGRLDGPHRQLLVDHYFPFASHQVILFSTDEEVTGDYYRRLAPAIGREYTIAYDEGRRTSVIVDGYLTQAALAA
jgi:DNA sulfur modification protein DndD